MSVPKIRPTLLYWTTLEKVGKDEMVERKEVGPWTE